jgi:hypothetical protein
MPPPDSAGQEVARVFAAHLPEVRSQVIEMVVTDMLGVPITAARVDFEANAAYTHTVYLADGTTARVVLTRVAP